MRIFTKAFVVLLIPLFFVYAAPTGKIAGIVTDASNGDAIPGANVYLESFMLGASTDGDGAFIILKVPPGKHDVVIDMVGFKKVTVTDVDVRIDQTTIIDVELESSIIEGEEITVVAQRPAVELDLTASKQRVTAEELQATFATTIEQVIDTQQGINISGGFRGGYGIDVTYLIDGIEQRDPMSKSNVTNIGISAIQEMEILTGGYNAEYGRANGAIVNIVTNQASSELHGSFNYRYRPAGKYHWGDNMYGESNYITRVALNPENADYWQRARIPGVSLTNEEKQAQFRDSVYNTPWLQVMKDYAQRDFHEFEGSLNGPITDGLSFNVSGRYSRDPGRFPSALAYSPAWYGMGSLNWKVSDNMTISLRGMHNGMDNGGAPRTLYMTSQEQSWSIFRRTTSIQFPTQNNYLYPLYGHWAAEGSNPPEYVRTWNGTAKLQYIFDANTYLDAHVNFYRFNREATFNRGDMAGWIYNTRRGSLGPTAEQNPDGLSNQDWYLEQMAENGLRDPVTARSWWINIPGFNYQNIPSGWGGDTHYDLTEVWTTDFKADFTSQIHPSHLIKAGAWFSYGYVDRIFRSGQGGSAFINDPIPNDHNPYEGAFYLQDKIETEGMIVNVGLRLDFFNANQWVSDNPWDPLRIDPLTPGNKGMHVISVGDPVNRRRVEEGDVGVVKTPTQVAISPRIGVAHPITETTVLHFMYGHFYERPSWMHITSLPWYRMNNFYPFDGMVPNYAPFTEQFYQDQIDWANEVAGAQGHMGSYDDHYGRRGNPNAEYEKMISYEIGIEQNLYDVVNLDFTLYYKDATNLMRASFNDGFHGDIGTHQWSGFAHDTGDPYMISRPGRGQGTSGSFKLYSNNKQVESRGIEIKVETRLPRWFNARLMYDLAYSTHGTYGPYFIPRLLDDGTRIDNRNVTYFGGSNGDGGVNRRRTDIWNPNQSLKTNAVFFTPEELGPEFLGIYPLGDWNITVQNTWAEGPLYTYHPPGVTSTEVLNRRWHDFSNTNLNVSKRINIGTNVTAILSMKVINLFDQRVLRQTNSTQYHEEGILPYVQVGPDGYEEQITNEWNIYDSRQYPREVFFEFALLF